MIIFSADAVAVALPAAAARLLRAAAVAPVVDADVVGLDNPASVRDVDKLYQQFKEQSLYVIEDMGIEIEQIITLVSCEYSYENGRILVHATLINEQNLK